MKIRYSWDLILLRVLHMITACYEINVVCFNDVWITKQKAQNIKINYFYFVDHNSENRTHVKGFEGAGEYQVALEYDVGWGAAIKIIDSSAACSQFMSWECKAAIIHNPYDPDMLTTFWFNRTEQMTNYFGGASPGSGNCACGETHSCFNTSLPCNCDANDEVWRVDEGWLTNKQELPIHSFFAGDTGLFFTLLY